MGTKDYLLGLWKTFVITATGLVAAWLANHGIHLGDTTATAITVALVAFGLAVYNTIVNWLLARVGDGPMVKLLHLLGKLLSLGGKAPVYPEPTPPPLVEMQPPAVDPRVGPVR